MPVPSWTYDTTKLTSTDAGYFTGSTIGVRYQIRLLIQDTNSARQLFQDQEIDWIQTQEMNAYTAAAALCDTLVAKAGGVKAKKISELAIQYDPVFYRQLAGTLRARGSGYQIPYAGGISIADKQAQQGDADWVQPAISRGLDNNPIAPEPANPPQGGSGTNGNPLTER
jgi:hypothetical protein